MLKINLLPKSFAERKKIRTTHVVMAVLLAAVIGGLMWMNSKRQTRIAELDASIADLQDEGAEVDRLKQEKQRIDNENAFLKGKVDFIDNVKKQNVSWAERYRLINRWTYNRVQYTVIQTSGNQAVMACMTDGMDSVARYYLNMLENCEPGGDFSSVSLSDLSFQYPYDPSAGANQDQPQGALAAYQNALRFTSTVVLHNPLPTATYAGAGAPITGSGNAGGGGSPAGGGGGGVSGPVGGQAAGG